MTAFFSVTNYDQQQHYKDRGPTWIKLYNRLLDDYGFAQLPDAAKWHLIGIFLLASRHNNRIPTDPAWLARQVGASDVVDLGVLEKSGHITPVPDVDDAWDLFGKRASPEKRREEERREEERREEKRRGEKRREEKRREEKTREEKTREEKNPLSAGADPAGVFVEGFEEFWSGYPTDRLMSKKKAHEIWRRMSTGDRAAAQGALPAFRDFIAGQKEYRVVHAWKFLSERRFEGFAAVVVDPAVAAAAKDRADRLLKRGKYAEKYE